MDPCSSLEPIPIGPKNHRRAFTEPELIALLNFVPHGRYVKYLFLVSTGLRRGEAAKAEWSWLQVASGRTWIRLPAQIAKSRKEQLVPIRDDLVRVLDEYQKVRGDEARIFDSIPEPATLRRDCLRAGIPERDSQGRQFDIHSLRTTFATRLMRAGIGPAVAKDLLRHADPTITIEAYTDVGSSDLLDAVDKLPNVTPRLHEDAVSGMHLRDRCKPTMKRSQGHADTCASEHDPAPVPRVGLEPTGNGAEIEDCSASAGVSKVTVPPGVTRDLRY